MLQTNRRIFLLTILCISGLYFLQSINSCTSRSQGGITVNTDTAKNELGRYLFFDRRLSINNTRSCATCHNPQFAFTDGYKRSLGAFADLHQRNTEPVFNLSYLKYLTAADSSLHLAAQQMNNPLFNNHPMEMGVNGNEEKILARIKADDLYKKLFAQSFPAEKENISWPNIKTAIAAFMMGIVSNNSAYDKYTKGDSNVLTASQKAGMQLFFSPALKCSNCHGGFNFSTPSVTDQKGETLFYFNTGLYNIDGIGTYPVYDQGLYEHTKQLTDMGAFRVPTLRNLAFTAPYFHDGSAASLRAVMDVYAAGGRKIEQGNDKGDGKNNPYKHPLINGFTLSENDKIRLIDFLLSLSDSSFISNPAYQNPFAGDETKKKY